MINHECLIVKLVYAVDIRSVRPRLMPPLLAYLSLSDSISGRQPGFLSRSLAFLSDNLHWLMNRFVRWRVLHERAGYLMGHFPAGYDKCPKPPEPRPAVDHRRTGHAAGSPFSGLPDGPVILVIALLIYLCINRCGAPGPEQFA